MGSYRVHFRMIVDVNRGTEEAPDWKELDRKDLSVKESVQAKDDDDLRRKLRTRLRRVTFEWHDHLGRRYTKEVVKVFLRTRRPHGGGFNVERIPLQKPGTRLDDDDVD